MDERKDEPQKEGPAPPSTPAQISQDSELVSSSPEQVGSSDSYSSSTSDSEQGIARRDYWDNYLMISSGLYFMTLASVQDKESENRVAHRDDYSEIFGGITFTFYDPPSVLAQQRTQDEQSLREGDERLEESSESTRSDVLVPTQGEGTEIMISDLGTHQSATDLTSTHRSSHSEGDLGARSIEGVTESTPFNHSAISASAHDVSLSDNVSNEQLQTGQPDEQPMIPERPTSTSPTSVQSRTPATKEV